jgi:hypothetical protein
MERLSYSHFFYSPLLFLITILSFKNCACAGKNRSPGHGFEFKSHCYSHEVLWRSGLTVFLLSENCSPQVCFSEQWCHFRECEFESSRYIIGS